MTRLIALFLAGVMLVGHGAGAATAVKAKPATPVAEATVEALTAADARLLTPVNLEAQQKRLHTIASQLTAMTGVTIRTGRNDQDWEVRDIPQTIWVKDIPLGRLLKAIADVSHLRLSVESIHDANGKTVRIYRIWRDSKMRKAIDDYVAATRQRSLAQDSWAWDALVKMGKSGAKPDPGAVRDPEMDKWGSTAEMSRTFGWMLSALGPEAKVQVFAGEHLQIRASDLPDPAVLQAFYKTAWTRYVSTNMAHSAPTQRFAAPPESDLRGVSITISMNMDPGDPSLQAYMPLRMGEHTNGAWNDSINVMADKAVKGVPGAPKRTDKPPLTDPMEANYPGFSVLHSSANDDASPLAAKIKLDIPNTAAGMTPTCAAVICGIARAAAINVVAEDFVSHRKQSYYSFDPIDPKTGVKVVDALLGGRSNWRFNPDQALLLGPSYGQLYNHRNLMPESVLTFLKDKASTTGLQIDDIMCLAPYEQRQLDAWIRDSRELVFLKPAAYWENKPYWRLYASLTPEDKALARSQQGVPLAKFDTARVSGLLQQSHENGFIGIRSGENDWQKQRREAEEKRTQQVLSDPTALAQLTLRVRTSMGGNYELLTHSDLADSFPYLMLEGQQLYFLTVTGTVGGQPYSVEEVWSWIYFPLYTPERHLELLKKEKEKQ